MTFILAQHPDLLKNGGTGFTYFFLVLGVVCLVAALFFPKKKK